MDSMNQAQAAKLAHTVIAWEARLGLCSLRCFFCSSYRLELVILLRER